jgi:endo-1,4-beta-xylanase
MPINAANISRRDALVGAAATLLALQGCGPGHPRLTGYAPPPLDVSGDHSLRVQAAAHGLLTGFALSVPLLRDSEPYRRVAAEQCSIAVAENAMKWGAIRPTRAYFDFDGADAFVQFCEAHHIKMRGHNLCWHESLPRWFLDTATADNARDLLVEHIRVVAGRYRGRMHSWDVVNEAIWIPDGRPDGLRTSPWLKLIGDDYIEVAFRAARQADPAALLTYDEYGIEGETEADQQKRVATLLLLRRLRQRNVPVDAVGIQSHIEARPLHGYGPALRSFIQSCRSMDLEVFLTEMDVDDRELPSDIERRDAGVAQTYADYLQAALAEPNVKAMLTWGVDDAQSWLTQRKPRADHEPQRPLLFDANFRPKPAFAAATRAFAGRGTARRS